MCVTARAPARTLVFVCTLRRFVPVGQAITEFFNDAVAKALGKPPPPGGTYVINVYINHERRFAFVEFGSIPLTTACMAFGRCAVCACCRPWQGCQVCEGPSRPPPFPQHWVDLLLALNHFFFVRGLLFFDDRWYQLPRAAPEGSPTK